MAVTGPTPKALVLYLKLQEFKFLALGVHLCLGYLCLIAVRWSLYRAESQACYCPRAHTIFRPKKRSTWGKEVLWCASCRWETEAQKITQENCRTAGNGIQISYFSGMYFNQRTISPPYFLFTGKGKVVVCVWRAISHLHCPQYKKTWNSIESLSLTS